MKVKVLKFCNSQRFRSYAVAYRKSVFSGWKLVLNMKGENALYRKEEAEGIAELISSGEYKKYETESTKEVAKK